MEKQNIGFCIGISANERLQKLISKQVNYVKKNFVAQGIKHQGFSGPIQYKADSWEKPQKVYAKIESTGKGLNVRYFVSNYRNQAPENLYKEFYVFRGDAAENRIKDINNYCFADRLSCSMFSANFLRLTISCLSYETLRGIKTKLPKGSKDPTICHWSIQSIRLYKIKVAAQVCITVRRVRFKFA